MTVKELIDKLQQFNGDRVIISIIASITIISILYFLQN